MKGLRRRRTLTAALLFALIATPSPFNGILSAAEMPSIGGTQAPQASAEELAIAATGTTGGWCVRGATFSVLFTAVFSIPGMITGIGAPYTAGRAAVAAVAGCGFAVAWRTMALAVSYVDSLVHPPLPLPPMPEGPRRGRDPALVETTG